jgi:hypothetical protein
MIIKYHPQILLSRDKYEKLYRTLCPDNPNLETNIKLVNTWHTEYGFTVKVTPKHDGTENQIDEYHELKYKLQELDEKLKQLKFKQNKYIH